MRTICMNKGGTAGKLVLLNKGGVFILIDYNHVLQKFKEYISEYNVQEPGIALKVSHSYHVADLAHILAKKLDLSEEEQILAKTIGLLHDIGRFPQYEKTKKYNDIKTHINHAELGVKYLFEEGHIKDFEIPEYFYPIIKKAILNHNKLKIEDDLSEKELLFAKFIRDIDKIDIYRAEATGFELTFEENITNDVKKMFENHTLIDLTKAKNESDNIVGTLAYLFDINFKESYELLDETDNLELFLSVIDVRKEVVKEFEELKKVVRFFLEGKIKND